MNPKNPMDSIFFVKLPETFKLTPNAFKIDQSIPLPVQQKDGVDSQDLDISSLTEEQILSGLLTVLAYDKNNKNLDYYRSILDNARPNLKKELAEAAILKTKNEDWDMAEEIWEALHGYAPNDMAIILNLALFFDQRADAYRQNSLNEDADAYDDSALEYYREAMNADPEIPDAFFNAGFFYLKKREFGDAKGAFENYLGLTAGVDEKDLGENGTYKKERAQEIIDKINSRNLENDLFKDAYKLISSGEEEKGLDKVRQFIQANPVVWNAWFLLGWGLRRLERFEDAKKAYMKALECEGGDESADTLNELAICQMETGDPDGALDSLNDALNLEPENVKVISNLGFLAQKNGDTEEAKKYFQTVLEINPEDKIAKQMLENLEA